MLNIKSKASSYVTRVEAYEPGIGFSVEFGSGLGFTNTVSLIGEPSRITPGDFGGPVDPFAPPYLSEQLLSIGEGGFVVLEFDQPVFDSPNNPHGLDFILFGNVGFIITNGDFTGGGITDGSLFGFDDAETSLWVSEDNENYYQLDPEKAPKLDSYYPTDGQGNFQKPVQPSLNRTDFADTGLEQIRQLYQGSGGGTGYDLAWAMGAQNLKSIRFVKIMVESGKVELDAASIVAPVPGAEWSHIEDDFSVEPLNGDKWRVHGESSLFAWDQEQERVSVTWDSRLPNSYFYLPLGSKLTRHENFSLQFDILVNNLELGIDPDKPFTFPLAVGLVNTQAVTSETFFRGSGIHEEFGPRGLVEWSYHADSGFGATISSGLISLDNQWSLANTFPLELQMGAVYSVEMNFDAESEVLQTTMLEDGSPFGPIREAKLSDVFGGPEGGFTDVDVDAFAIASYNDGGQPSPEFAGSVLADGWIDNIAIQRERFLIIENLHVSGEHVSVEIEAQTGWEYWLERTSDFIHWETRGHVFSEDAQRILIEDQGDTSAKGFYRVVANRR